MGFPLPPGPVQAATIALTSAQILALNTTPITIVPAPGAGLAITPLSAIANYQYKGTAYVDAGGNFVVESGGIGFLQRASAGFWDQASSRMMILVSANGLQPNWTNGALQVTCTVGNPTTGNGLVTVTVLYVVTAAA